ncbi:MAG: S4 domain-containing protein, partial [Bacillota bacterium]
GAGGGMENLPVVEIEADALQSTDREGNELGGLGVAAFLTKLGLTSSNRDAMDVIKQGGLKIDGEKITDPKTLIKTDSFGADGMLVEKGKKKKVIAKLK